MQKLDKTMFTGDKYASHYQYWEQFVGGCAGEFRFVQKSPGGPAGEWVEHEDHLSAGAREALAARAGERDADRFVLLLASFGLLLEKYTGQDEIIVDTPLFDFRSETSRYAGRVPVRLGAGKAQTFRACLAQCQRSIRDAYAYQNFPLEVLSPEAPGRCRTNVLVRYAGLHHSVEDTRAYDLVVTFSGGPAARVTVAYNAGAFEAYFIHRTMRHLEQVLACLHQPDVAPGAISILPAEERDQVLAAFNPAPEPLPRRTVVQLFEAQVAQRPGHPAVIAGPVRLSYQALNGQANQLAHYLRETGGVRPGTVVGVMAERSERLVIAALAVLKAGGVYLPIDPLLPHKRRQHLLADAGVQLLLTESAFLFDVDYYAHNLFALDLQLPVLDTPATDPAPAAGLADPAYIIYTSGSTGDPKGVPIRHAAISARAAFFRDYFPVGGADVVLLFAAIGFDASLYEMLLALLSGATLVVAGTAEKNDTNRCVDLLRTHGVTIATFPPAFLRLLSRAQLPALRKIISTGEAAVLEDALHFAGTGEFYNGYGPTEACIGATIYRVTAGNRESCRAKGLIPIGRPFGNTKVYVLDRSLQPVPTGIAGELYVAGVGLSAGYLHSPALTAERFVPNPFAAGESEAVMYRTGDLGRWNGEGVLEFTGRADNQVQVRGIRVEPGEIEQVLLRHPSVAEAVVVAGQNDQGATALVAYWVAAAGKSLPFPPAQAGQALRTFLRQFLPEYMIPNTFVGLEALPVTVNGKVDRKALPDPRLHAGSGADFAAPADAQEQMLLEIWKDVLRKEHIGTRDDFFDVGGNSLSAVQMATRIYKATGVQVEVKMIFAEPTIEKLARTIREAGPARYTRLEPVAPHPHYEVSAAQKRLWILAQLGDTVAYNIPLAFFLTGPLQEGALEQAFHALINRHESLRTTFAMEAGEVRQKIHAVPAGVFTRQTLPATATDAGAEVSRLTGEEARQVFDLERGTLLRARLVGLEPGRYLFLLTMHHIIGDNRSMQVLVSELCALYNAFATGTPANLPPLAVQYKDYAHWSNRFLAGERLDRHRQYWGRSLGGQRSLLHLPARTPGATRGPAGDAVRFECDEKLTGALRDLGKSADASLYMVLLSAVNVLLHKYSGQTDILIGTSASLRTHLDLEDQVGLYLNQLALRTRFGPEDSFSGLLAAVKEVTLGAYEHQMYPLDQLVEQLDAIGPPAQGPLFGVMVDLQDARDGAAEARLTGVTVESVDTGIVFSRMDLTFNFKEYTGTVEGSIQYSTDLFRPQFAGEMMQYFTELLPVVAGNPRASIREAIGACDARVAAVQEALKKGKRSEKLHKLLQTP